MAKKNQNNEKPDSLQAMADEVMEQVQVEEIWRLEDGRWYTREAKAIERNERRGKIKHFVKTK